MGSCPLGHTSLDAPIAGEHSLLDELAAPAAESALEPSITGPALGQLVEQLPAQLRRCRCWAAGMLSSLRRTPVSPHDWLTS
jgi:hypothetical protein